MLRILRLVPAFEVLRPEAGLGPARRFVRAVLLRVAARAVQIAARLERVEAPEQAVQLEVIRPYAGGGAAVRFAEIVVYLAVAVYFVAGLVGAFVA